MQDEGLATPLATPLHPSQQHEWSCGLPADVLRACLAPLAGPELAAARRVCSAWRCAADAGVRHLHLSGWPSAPRALARFAAVEALALRCAAPTPLDGAAGRRAASLLLAAIAHLPRLTSLEIPLLEGAGGAALVDGLTAASRLTRLELRRTASALPASVLWPPPPPQAARHAPGGVAATAPLLWFEAGPGGGGGGDADDGDGDGAPTASAAGAAAAAAALPALEALALCNAGAPDYRRVAAALPALRRLELRGHALHGRGGGAPGAAAATGPLPGVSVLTRLTALAATRCYGLSRLPGLELARLTLLEDLDVSKNMLLCLPDELQALPRLRRLDVSSNCLSTLPSGALPSSLTFLDASNNSRMVVPASVGCLSQLRELRLNWLWSDLSAVFEAAPRLTALEVLHVAGNGASALPAAVGDFAALRSLDLSMNHLETLPPEMGRLTSLTALDASDNRLRAIPAALLGGARALARVAARSNALTELPESVGCLTALTTLDVSMNRLAGLPESFTQLTALEHLALSMNPLATLPHGLDALRRLREVELYYVRLPARAARALSRLARARPGLCVRSDAAPYGAPIAPNSSGGGGGGRGGGGNGSARAPAELPLGAPDGDDGYAPARAPATLDGAPGRYAWSSPSTSGSGSGSSAGGGGLLAGSSSSSGGGSGGGRGSGGGVSARGVRQLRLGEGSGPVRVPSRRSMSAPGAPLPTAMALPPSAAAELFGGSGGILAASKRSFSAGGCGGGSGDDSGSDDAPPRADQAQQPGCVDRTSRRKTVYGE